MMGDEKLAEAEAALAELHGKIRADEPLHAISQAQLIAVQVIRESVQEIKAVVAEHGATQAAAPLLTLAEEKRLIEDIKRELRAALYKQAAEAHRQIKWRTLAATLTIGFVLAAAAGGGGYWRGWVAADNQNVDMGPLGQMPVGAAARWSKFARLNPSGFNCRDDTDKPTGRPTCVAALFSEPAPPPK